MKKKICYINCSSNGSTGNIIKNLIENNSQDFDFCCILGEKSSWIDKEHILSIGDTNLSYKRCRTETFLFGNDGFISFAYRKRIEKFLKKEKPDIVHIHNPHRSFCNIETVFNYCYENNVKIIWTLHDLWAFTGRCCTPLDCKGWLDGCKRCQHKNYFPRVIFNQSAKYFKKKTELYGLASDNLIFVSPSTWMNQQAQQHSNKSRKIVINNGINTDIFSPSCGNPEIITRAKNRFIVGAAALYFNELKGKSDFIKIANDLDKDKYFFVLIGTDDKEITFLEENIMAIPKTFSQKDMASFYNSLNVFVNPTKTDNYPTTHLESIACGTPVITYDVGGAKEMIVEGKTGFAVPLNDTEAIIEKIIYIDSNREKFDRKTISTTSDFSLKTFCKKYKDLYLDMLNNSSTIK